MCLWLLATLDMAATALALWSVWAAGQGSFVWPWLLPLACLCAGLGLYSFWRAQAPRRVLAWDGQGWTLEENGKALATGPGRLQVRLDMQGCLLLRHTAPAGAPGPRRRWLWADAGMQPAHWHLLRCALYSFAPDRTAGRFGAATSA